MQATTQMTGLDLYKLKGKTFYTIIAPTGNHE